MSKNIDIVKAYDNGVQDGYNYAISNMNQTIFLRGKESGQFIVAEKTLALLLAAKSATPPHDAILMQFAVEFLYGHVPGDVTDNDRLEVDTRLVRVTTEGVYTVPVFEESCGCGRNECADAANSEKCWYYGGPVIIDDHEYARCVAAAAGADQCLDESCDRKLIECCDHGSEGLMPVFPDMCPDNKELGECGPSCISGSGSSICGGFLGTKVVGKIRYVVCQGSGK